MSKPDEKVKADPEAEAKAKQADAQRRQKEFSEAVAAAGEKFRCGISAVLDIEPVGNGGGQALLAAKWQVIVYE